MRNCSIFLKEPENLLFAYLEYQGTDIEKDIYGLQLRAARRGTGRLAT